MQHPGAAAAQERAAPAPAWQGCRAQGRHAGMRQLRQPHVAGLRASRQLQLQGKNRVQSRLLSGCKDC